MKRFLREDTIPATKQIKEDITVNGDNREIIKSLGEGLAVKRFVMNEGDTNPIGKGK